MRADTHIYVQRQVATKSSSSCGSVELPDMVEWCTKELSSHTGIDFCEYLPRMKAHSAWSVYQSLLRVNEGAYLHFLQDNGFSPWSVVRRLLGLHGRKAFTKILAEEAASKHFEVFDVQNSNSRQQNITLRTLFISERPLQCSIPYGRALALVDSLPFPAIRNMESPWPAARLILYIGNIKFEYPLGLDEPLKAHPFLLEDVPPCSLLEDISYLASTE